MQHDSHRGICSMSDQGSYNEDFCESQQNALLFGALDLDQISQQLRFFLALCVCVVQGSVREACSRTAMRP